MTCNALRVMVSYYEVYEGNMIKQPIGFGRSHVDISEDQDWSSLRNYLSGYVPRKWIINEFLINDHVVWRITDPISSSKNEVGEFLMSVLDKGDPIVVIGKSTGN